MKMSTSNVVTTTMTEQWRPFEQSKHGAAGTHRRHGRRRAVLGPLLLTLALGGCAAESNDAIRLGLAAPIGTTAGDGMYQGALLAVEEINQGGGIDGRMLELDVRDDRMDAARAIEVAAEFRDESDVVAVVGHLTSGATVAAAERYDGLLAISPGATSPELSGASEWVFRVCPSDLHQSNTLADWAYEHLELDRAAILYVNDAYGRGVLTAFAPAFEELGGTIVGRSPYLPSLLEDGVEIDAYLERAIRAGMDALVIVGVGDEVPEIVRTARALGYRGPVLGTDGLIGMAQAGPVGEGTYVTAGFLPDRPTDEAREFVRRYSERFGQAPRDGSAHAYDTVKLLARAIREAGTDRRALRDYVAGIGTVHPAFEGVTGTIRFDEAGDAIGKDVAVGMVRDGQIVTVLAADSPELHR